MEDSAKLEQLAERRKKQHEEELARQRARLLGDARLCDLTARVAETTIHSDQAVVQQEVLESMEGIEEQVPTTPQRPEQQPSQESTPKTPEQRKEWTREDVQRMLDRRSKEDVPKQRPPKGLSGKLLHNIKSMKKNVADHLAGRLHGRKHRNDPEWMPYLNVSPGSSSSSSYQPPWQREQTTELWQTPGYKQFDNRIGHLECSPLRKLAQYKEWRDAKLPWD